jgi:hypothetical protein
VDQPVTPPRSEILKFRVTPEEADLLRADAEERDMDLSTLLRSRVLKSDPLWRRLLRQI